MEPVLELKNVSFRYSKDSRRVLNDLSYSFEEGKLYAIVGRSGAGKTTLLSLLSGLAVPEKGEVLMRGENIANLDRYHYRSHDIGVIFQDYRLLESKTVFENIAYALEVIDMKPNMIRSRVRHVLRMVDLTEKSNAFPNELSGGEQQRIGIARAVLNSPQIILADEPTGNLDMETGQIIAQLLSDLSRKGSLVVVTTHNLRLLQDFPGRVFRCAGHSLEEVSGLEAYTDKKINNITK